MIDQAPEWDLRQTKVPPSERSDMKLPLALAVAWLAGTAAVAQNQNCAQREVVLSRLNETYGESRQSIGIAGQGQVVEVFASLETGTWTITVTLPNGMTCLVASGQAFEHLNEPLRPAGIRS